ncbi:Hypothetical_protein [Hexamita inflata]|uniref:Hypothetical_protein n=1 Tax=Hexamita inflata TaxID=28002 RepID=A0AA86Q5H5_9EUKA|nr:Hypothetical protein HINF_LOCUS3974 [Hexamita inflata]CAI9949968.1 Hypothetical protein HINF_LOCUS37613 [Hexamita inflata]
MPFRQRLHQAVRGDERQVQDGLFAILRYICQYHLTASQISGYALVNQFVSKCETTFLFPASPFPPASTQTSVKIFDNIDCTQTMNKQLKMTKTFIETNENGTEAVVDGISFFQLKEKVVCVFVLVRFEWNLIDFVSNCSFYDYILAHLFVKYFQHSIQNITTIFSMTKRDCALQYSKNNLYFFVTQVLAKLKINCQLFFVYNIVNIHLNKHQWNLNPPLKLIFLIKLFLLVQVNFVDTLVQSSYFSQPSHLFVLVQFAHWSFVITVTPNIAPARASN